MAQTHPKGMVLAPKVHEGPGKCPDRPEKWWKQPKMA